MNSQMVAYLESLVAGAAMAGADAALQAYQQHQSLQWQGLVAAGLLGALGYLQVALRWLHTPPPPPPSK